ncbi:glycoside hydrolase family 2 protein [Lasiosphaeria hispida]|uniref:Beta-mannosidase B n=1 Tax=Lasiosphaeria hispida TaxID=260671 RepID=A0AAJ0HER3_9PEZI|nr:glycoside hydrolase family 2 protein [Lasiosphaeria hispida]
MTRHTVQALSTGWEFKSSNDSTWRSARVPSEVHTELLRHDMIPDPFVDLNELDVAWVAEETWHYRTEISLPETATNNGVGTDAEIDLVFEGLDTFATVILNGETILKSENMFLEHRVAAKHLLNPATANTLEIVFEPARRRGLELVEAHPEHDFIVHQTEVSRGPVRKAQSHWGWDWGPILLACGPWKPVRLETYANRIQNVRLDYEVDLTGPSPVVEVNLSAGIVGLACRVVADLVFVGETIVSFEEVVSSEAQSGMAPWVYKPSSTKIVGAKLWWPRGYGSQDLYELRVRAVSTDGDGSTVLAEERQTVGFRRTELIQEKDTIGQSFYFRINGVDIFIGGSCWIPADSFLSRITPQRYQAWIHLLADGNQTMIRIWGGGIYESSAFYAACDSLGILVWQDFMFACASYPTYPSFLTSITTEARQNIGRLRHHPSLVLWCGNNEDYQLIERYDLEYNFPDKDPASWLKTNFPARYIYEHLLPTLLASESHHTPYHPGSPWGTGTSPTLAVDPTVGDIHQWNVWHGTTTPYQRLPDMGGRFVSEFGIEAYPHRDTLHRLASDPAQRFPGSPVLDFNNKAVGHERRMLTYLGENFRVPADLGGFAHLTQVMQADAMAWAYKGWRRRWGREGLRGCGGVLVWQLNDCWPTVSWAVVDYFLVKKPAWYAIRRAMEPLAVGVVRKFHDWTARPADALWRRDTGHVDPREALTDVEFDVWVASSRLERVEGRVVVRFVSVKTGRDVKERLEREVDMEPNACTEILVGFKFETDVPAKDAEHFVIHASLWVGGEQVSNDTSWPDPIKYLNFADRGVQVKSLGQDLFEISAEKPVKGFVFSEKPGVKVSDNGFDIIPGEKAVRVRIEGAESEAGGLLPWAFVGQ